MNREIFHTATLRLAKPRDSYLIQIGDRWAPLSLAALRQIADFCGIPYRYFSRCLIEAPELACAQANYWLQYEPTTRALITDEGMVIAFESPRKALTADVVGA